MYGFKSYLYVLLFVFMLSTFGLSAAQIGSVSQSTEIAKRGGGHHDGGHRGSHRGSDWGRGHRGDWGHRNSWGGAAFYWGPSVGLYNYNYRTPSYYYQNQYPYNSSYNYPYYNYYYNQY